MIALALLSLALAADPPRGVYALSGLELDLPLDDLAPLGAIVGEATVVGLGESFHMSGGYYDAKARLFRYLVEEEGFRVLAMETPWLPAEAAARYVETCEGTPLSAVGSVFGYFQDVATARLLEWMCRWNQRNPGDPVSFTGFDVQQPRQDAERLGALLPSLIGEAEAGPLLADIRGCSGALSHPGYDEGGRLNRPSRGSHRRCLAALDALAARLPEGDPRTPWAELSILGLRASQEHDFAARDRVASYEARDEGMAEALLRLRELRFPGEKIAIWAHNEHLAAARDRVRTRGDDWVSLGTHLRARLGDEYAPVGLIGWDVDTAWGPGVPADPLDHPSVAEARLRALGLPALLLDLAASDVLAPGEAYWCGGTWQVPAEQFRALLFLDHSRALLHPAWSPFGAEPALLSQDGDRQRRLHAGEIEDLPALVAAYAALYGSREWTVIRATASGSAARLEATRDGRRSTVDLAWDAPLGGYAADLYTEPPAPIRDAAGLAAASGGEILLEGRLSADRSRLDLRDARVPTRAGDFPSAWGGLSIQARCAATADGSYRCRDARTLWEG